MQKTINEVSEKALEYHFRKEEVLRQAMSELEFEGLSVNYI